MKVYIYLFNRETGAVDIIEYLLCHTHDERDLHDERDFIALSSNGLAPALWLGKSTPNAGDIASTFERRLEHAPSGEWSDLRAKYKFLWASEEPRDFEKCVNEVMASGIYTNHLFDVSYSFIYPSITHRHFIDRIYHSFTVKACHHSNGLALCRLVTGGTYKGEGNYNDSGICLFIPPRVPPHVPIAIECGPIEPNVRIGEDGDNIATLLKSYYEGRGFEDVVVSRKYERYEVRK